MLGQHGTITAPSKRPHCFITAMKTTPHYSATYIANYSALPQATPEAQAHWKL